MSDKPGTKLNDYPPTRVPTETLKKRLAVSHRTNWAAYSVFVIVASHVTGEPHALF